MILRPLISTLFPYTTLFRSLLLPVVSSIGPNLLEIAIRITPRMRDWMFSSVVSTAEPARSEEHTSELQSPMYLVCRLLLEKKNIELRRTSPHHKYLDHGDCT